MKSPAEQKIIQIDITNACTHACSNCTRFCGHHEQPFMMDFETFKRAVDSLKDFPGMVGIMGGEPTLHPEFERFVEYYASVIGPAERSARGREPIVDFGEYRTEHLSDVNRKRGLWSSLGKGYYQHFELIQEVFDYQCINDHRNPGEHQALLVSRKELGVTDEEWIPLRDQCWIQNLWSSTVTPKGAFFCEVAGALDTLFDGPGGWDVNSEWWKRTPEQFGEQLNWCELCGAALQVPRRQANEEVDDVSPALLKKLEAVNSPKVRKQQVEALRLETYSADRFEVDPSVEWYLPSGDNAQRVAGTNRSLYPQEIVGVYLTNLGTELPLAVVNPWDHCAVLPSSSGVKAWMSAAEANDWVLVVKEGVALREDFGEQLRSLILNPGCLYYQSSQPEEALAHVGGLSGEWIFLLFNVRARALRTCGEQEDLFVAWPAEKRIELNRWFLRQQGANQRTIEGEMLARHMASLWQSVSVGRNAVIFGGGQHTHWLLKVWQAFELELPEVILDDAAGAEQRLEGIAVRAPEVSQRPDVVFLSANTRRISEVLARRCREVWGDAVWVVDPYAGFECRSFRKILPTK